MYVRSLNQNSKSKAKRTASSHATSSSGSNATSNTISTTTNIWSAIALQRHYAALMPQGALPTPLPLPPPQQSRAVVAPTLTSTSEGGGGGDGEGEDLMPSGLSRNRQQGGRGQRGGGGGGRGHVGRGRAREVNPTNPPHHDNPQQSIASANSQTVAAGSARNAVQSVRHRNTQQQQQLQHQPQEQRGLLPRDEGIHVLSVAGAVSRRSANVEVIPPAITRGGIAVSGSSGAVHTSRKEQLAAAALGLIELPPPPPSDSEWTRFVGQAEVRGRESVSHHACPICQERFMTDPKAPLVILNCTHVFHKTCLSQLEKFLTRAREKICCPMCRKGNYYKRPLVEGTAQIESLAASKIQAWVRGRKARREYLRMRLKANPEFRSNFAFSQLSRISDYYLNAAIAREKELDEMLEAMDLQRQKAMADMMSEADWDEIRMKILRRALEPNEDEEHKRKNKLKHDSVATTSGGGGRTVDEDTDFDQLSGEEDDANDANTDQKEDESDTCHGGGVECPICMCDIVEESTGDCDPTAVMLSCSHVFHGPCLDAFERMRGGGGGSAPLLCIPRCAVCRKGYARRPLIDTR